MVVTRKEEVKQHPDTVYCASDAFLDSGLCRVLFPHTTYTPTFLPNELRDHVQLCALHIAMTHEIQLGCTTEEERRNMLAFYLALQDYPFIEIALILECDSQAAEAFYDEVIYAVDLDDEQLTFIEPYETFIKLRAPGYYVDKSGKTVSVDKAVMSLLRAGCSDDEIAERLSIDIQSVMFLRKRMIAEYLVSNNVSGLQHLGYTEADIDNLIRYYGIRTI